VSTVIPLVKLYRPSNGTEGMIFYEDWCMHCARDKPMSEGKELAECSEDEVCPIIGSALTWPLDDPNYPREWRYGKDGMPCCTAFVQSGHPVPLRDRLRSG
jgi:hypothetical protein